MSITSVCLFHALCLHLQEIVWKKHVAGRCCKELENIVCVLVCVFLRNYFGEKVALYYLWLGWYTYLLIPPAVIGVVVFLYGLTFFNSSPLM